MLQADSWGGVLGQGYDGVPSFRADGDREGTLEDFPLSLTDVPLSIHCLL